MILNCFRCKSSNLKIIPGDFEKSGYYDYQCQDCIASLFHCGGGWMGISIFEEKNIVIKDGEENILVHWNIENISKKCSRPYEDITIIDCAKDRDRIVIPFSQSLIDKWMDMTTTRKDIEKYLLLL